MAHGFLTFIFFHWFRQIALGFTCSIIKLQQLIVSPQHVVIRSIFGETEVVQRSEEGRIVTVEDSKKHGFRSKLAALIVVLFIKSFFFRNATTRGSSCKFAMSIDNAYLQSWKISVRKLITAVYAEEV